MRKVTLTFGLIAGSIVSGFMIIGLALYEKNGKIFVNELIGYATMVIALSMVFFGIKSYRDNYQKGVINFWKGLLEILPVGILITLISAAVLRKKEFLPA